MFIEILFKMLLFKGGVLICAEHCMCMYMYKCVYIYTYIYVYIYSICVYMYMCVYIRGGHRLISLI